MDSNSGIRTDIKTGTPQQYRAVADAPDAKQLPAVVRTNDARAIETRASVDQAAQVKAVGRAPKLGPAVASATPGTVTVAQVQDEMGVARQLDYIGLETVNGAKDVPLKDVFPDYDKEGDLIVGIDVNGNTQGHMYLIVDGVRIDGRMFFKGHDETSEPQISNGLAIRYRNIPEPNRTKLLEFVRSSEALKSPSCVATACKILYREAGFESGAKRPTHWFPGPYLKTIAEHGISGESGERMTPEIYTVNTEVERFWNNLPTWKGVWRFLVPVFKDTFGLSGDKT